MLRAAIKRVLRPIRRMSQHFIGISELRAKLDGLSSQNELIQRQLLGALVNETAETSNPQEYSPQVLQSWSESIDILYSLSEKVDVLLHHRHSTDRTDLHISREVDRLDGYLQYHASMIRDELQRLRQQAQLLDGGRPTLAN